MTAREAALRTLLACEKQDAWADVCLKRTLKEGGLDGREAALATRLTFGVVQNRILLDWYVDQFARGKLDASVRNILRLGAYQLLFLTRVPARAAVDESVKLTRQVCKNPKAAGLVNAVLRNLERNKADQIPPEDLSIRYSHPQWLVDAFTERLGSEGAAALLAADNGEPAIAIQHNKLKCSEEELQYSLERDGAEVSPHPWLPGCFLLTGGGDLEALHAFQGGWFYVQDPAARLAVLAVSLKPGDKILDACAAPGGKSFAAAIDMENTGEITSCDIHPHKITLIEKGAARLGLSRVSAQVQNAKECVPAWAASFDAVLADVPCSGLGIIRKKPDIRFKDPAPLAGLPEVQENILNNVSAYVKPGGVLLYSTCTLLERENEGVVRTFLERHPDFALEGFALPGPIGGVKSGMLTLWPHIHGTDGFFLAKLRKRL